MIQFIGQIYKFKMEKIEKSRQYRDMSTTWFQIHPKTNLSISFKNSLPIRPYCFSVNNSNRCRSSHHLSHSLTFKPKIRQIPFQIYPQSNKIKITKQDRYQRLFKDKRGYLFQIQQIKHLQQQNQLKQCTFQPNSQKDYQKKHSQQNKVVFQRLYEDAVFKERYQTLNLNQKINSFQNHSKYIQKDLLNSQKHNLQPLHLRLKQIIEKRVQERKRLIQNNQQHFPFHPLINNDYVLQNNKPVVQRLLEQIEKNKIKRNKLIEKYQKLQNQKLTFKPLLNTYIPCNNLNQQDHFILNQTKSSLNQSHHQNFHPKINHMSDFIVKHLRGTQNQFDRINRLTNGQIQRKKQNLIKIAEDAYKQYTFNPEINQISKQLTSNHISHCCNRAELPNYSFKPQINQNSLSLAKNRNQEALRQKSISNRIKNRNQQEYEIMKECTFRPKINSRVMSSERSIKQVQGIKTYISKVQMIEFKAKERKAIQQKLFNLEKRYDQRIKRKGTKRSLK